MHVNMLTVNTPAYGILRPDVLEVFEVLQQNIESGNLKIPHKEEEEEG